MTTPKISILIPIYNVEAYLQRCIDSVLAQDFQDWEMILVDDGSPDRCPQICDEAAAKDERIRVVHKENGGLVSARKTGFLASHGEYLVFVDSDDTLRPGALTTLYGYITQGYDMVRASGVRKTNDAVEYPLERYELEDGEVANNEDFIANFFRGRVAPYLWGAIYRRELFSAEVFDYGIEGRISLGEDWVTNLIAGRNANRALYVRDVVYDYYFNPDSIMGSSIWSDEYQDRVDETLRRAGIMDYPVVQALLPMKRACDTIGHFFQPELPFSVARYRALRPLLGDAEAMAELRRRLPRKWLRFINHPMLYRLYVTLWRVLIKWVKLKGKSRKVLN